MKMLDLFKAFTYRSFALLWGGQTVSRLGDYIYQVALVWWVLQNTGSAIAMGIVLICTQVPMLLFLLLGGVTVDRLPRLRLMMLSDVTRCALVSIVAFLAFTHTLAIWHIYIASLVFGVVSAFFIPAYNAALPELVSTEILPSTNSLTSLSRQISGIIGPAIGAAIVAVGGSQFAFALDALSFFISASCLLPLLKRATSPKSGAVTQSILGAAGEGLTYVFRTPWIWITIGVACISNITYYAPVGVALPFFVKNLLKANVGILGLFYSATAFGAMLGAIWIGRSTSISRRGLKLYAVWMLLGIMLVVIGITRTVSIFLLAAAVIGISDTLVGLIWVNMLQERVPRELQGRVYSIDNLGSYLFAPVGYLLGGWATPLLGPALVFILGGALQTGLIGLGLLNSQIRNLD